MNNQKNIYLKLLKIELEDLNSDIDLLIEELKGQKKRDEISNYVFVENLALFKNEIVGVEVVNESLTSIDIDKFSSLDSMIDEIRSRIKEKIKISGIANALFVSVNRKLDKVKKYII